MQNVESKADGMVMLIYHGGAVEEDGAVAESREELLLGLAAVQDKRLVGARQDGGAVGRCPDGVAGRGRGQRYGVRHELLQQPVDRAVHATRCRCVRT
jgi:hypothetical protein